MQAIIEWLVDFVHHFGYIGIFIMTFLESTFVPIPSEVTMIPAGYLVHQGEMALLPVLFASVTGTIGGSLAMYFLAKHVGRRFLYAYGKYFLLAHDKLEMLDKYFASHGEISIFTGRLIPGLRHVISFPAGLAHMDLKKFCIYTGVGGGIWMATLIFVGYIIGGNKAMVKEYMPYITALVITGVCVMIVCYICRHRRKARGNGAS